MNQYHIRIDGEQSTDSYTYQELVDMGLFELDKENLNGIEVKKTTNKIFEPIKSFCFPERQSNESSYHIDEYGQIHRGPASSSVPNNSTSSTTSSSSSTSTTSSSTGSSNTPSSSSSSSNDDNDMLWRIVVTIVVLAIGIPVLVNVGLEGFWGYAVVVVSYFILGSIWDWL